MRNSKKNISNKIKLFLLKNNIRYLLLTAKGERLMHPDMGLNLREYLFEQIDEEAASDIENSVRKTMSKWLPFVTVKDLQVNTSGTGDVNSISVSCTFYINNDPRITDSVDVAITGE